MNAAIAIAASAALCLGIFVLLPRTLEVRTPIVGYPIYANFDYGRYFDAFYLVALVFPLLAGLLYLLLARLAGVRRSRGNYFPIARPGLAGPMEPSGAGVVLPAACRVALPALVIAVERAAATGGSSLAPADFGAGVLYAGVTLLVAACVRPRGWRPFGTRLSLVNGLGALVVIPLLYPVSRATEVTIASPPRVVGYPWFPWWAAFVATVVGIGAAARFLRRGGGALALERRIVYAVVGALLLFLCVASLPGALGPFGGFDDAQYLAGAQLTFGHGLLPWRDVYLLHGFFEDDFQGEFGFLVFSHTRWGAIAGLTMFIIPASYVVMYLFTLYFARGRRLLAPVLALVVLAGQLDVVVRFIYLPLLLIVFDRVVGDGRRRFALCLGALVVFEAILTPEVALMAVVLLIALVLFELSTRAAATPLRRSFPALTGTVLGGLAIGVPFLAYLVATRSLGGFVDYYRFYGSDHALWGAQPFQWPVWHDLQPTVQFALPIAAWLGAAWVVLWRVRTRRGLTSRHWCMVAAGGFVVAYFQKGLDRLDPGHVGEVFTVATPLIVLLAIELADCLDGILGRALHGLAARLSRFGRLVGGFAFTAPLTALAGVFLLVAVVPVSSTIEQSPTRLHATSPTVAPPGLLGYTAPGAVNLPEIDTLQKIVDGYAAGGPVFDFTNEPGLTYFLYNEVPGASTYHVESAQTLAAQNQVVAQLEASRPRLVIYTDYDFGLPLVDFIVGSLRNYVVARYVLSTYRPFADIDGQLVLIRDDLYRSVPPVRDLHLPGVAGASRKLYFQTFDCAMGDIPDFLVPPTLAGRTSSTLRLGSAPPVNTTITGWAVDDRQLQPAREVFAVLDGKVIGSAVPQLVRPDIAAYYRSNAVLYSGFDLDLDLVPGAPVKVYALNADGTVSRIQPDPQLHLPRSLRSSAHDQAANATGGRYRVVRGSHLSGWVNSDVRFPTERTFTISLPKGEALSSFAWATISAPGGLGASTFTLSDGTGASGHAITWSSLAGRSDLYAPVGSCPQWYGYGRHLVLRETGANPPRPVIRLYK